ncbi:tyrosine-type recombinase/integrase [Vibrio astriarenae]
MNRRGSTGKLIKRWPILVDHYNSRYIFPSPHKNSDKPMSKNTIGKLLRELGFKNIMTAHGTRSTFSTEMHEKLEPSDSVVIEMVLSHVDKDSVRQVYNRKSFVKKRRDILNQWGAMYAEITRDCSCTAFVKNELQKHNLL